MLEAEATGQLARMATSSGQKVLEPEKLSSRLSRKPVRYQ